MIETLERAYHDSEREDLQNHLATIDRDPDELQRFISDLYTGYIENPHILYAAATHLTALTYLDRRNETDQVQLPERLEAGRAFMTYTRMLTMLGEESDAPLYKEDTRIRRRLVGTREELAFHATLAYATAQGGDFVALPAPAHVDFTGAHEASDLQVFFPCSDQSPLEIQVTFDTKGKAGKNYHPRIPILSLVSVLDVDKAAEVRGLLRSVGNREDRESGKVKLRRREHGILLNASASILQAAQQWGNE